MPLGVKFTNATPGSSGGSSSIPRNRPYVSGPYGNKVMPLTDREREARRQARMGSTYRSAGFGIDPVMNSNTVMSGASSFFSPQLSTDFLQLPQSIREKRELYRHYYNTDEIVAQAIDLHTELPLSKIRLAAPKPSTHPDFCESPEDYGHYIHSFFQRMVKRIKLFQKLVLVVHHLWLDGTSAVFAEDGDVEVPSDVGFEKKTFIRSFLTDAGEPVELKERGLVERDNREEEELRYYQKHYQGWERLIVFPIDQLKITSFSFSDKLRIELIPSERDKELIQQAKLGDPVAEEMVAEIPDEVREYLSNNKLIPLGTNPEEGSFCYALTMRKQADGELGQSILDRCLRTLTLREKLRQAQTQIADRAMTPKRIVWADDISDADADDLREQVDLSLVDPDYTIVANYEIHWEEMGSKDRLLDLSTEYEQSERRLRTGLGVTESLLSGETLYSGDRLKLEVINQRYLFLREIIQDYVEEHLFKPVARRKGFIEKDKWGEEVVLFPKLSFTRLPLRDSQDTYDQMFNLYQKGSLPVEYIYEVLNLDPDDIQNKLKKDLFTVLDSLFNEGLRGAYGAVGEKLVASTDLFEKLIQSMGLQKKAQADTGENDRFG